MLSGLRDPYLEDHPRIAILANIFQRGWLQPPNQKTPFGGFPPQSCCIAMPWTVANVCTSWRLRATSRFFSVFSGGKNRPWSLGFIKRVFCWSNFLGYIYVYVYIAYRLDITLKFWIWFFLKSDFCDFCDALFFQCHPGRGGVIRSHVLKNSL